MSSKTKRGADKVYNSHTHRQYYVRVCACAYDMYICSDLVDAAMCE